MKRGLLLFFLFLLSISQCGAQQWRERMIASSTYNASYPDSNHYSYTGFRGLLSSPSRVGVDFDTNRTKWGAGWAWKNMTTCTYDNHNKKIGTLYNTRRNSYTYYWSGNLASTRTEDRDSASGSWVWIRTDYHTYDIHGRIISDSYMDTAAPATALKMIDSFEYSAGMHDNLSDSVISYSYSQNQTDKQLTVNTFWPNNKLARVNTYIWQGGWVSNPGGAPSSYDTSGQNTYTAYYTNVFYNTNTYVGFDSMYYDSAHRLTQSFSFQYDFYMTCGQLQNYSTYRTFFAYDSLGNYDSITTIADYSRSYNYTGNPNDTIITHFWYESLWDTSHINTNQTDTTTRPSGILSIDKEKTLCVYPNPSQGYFSIRFDAVRNGDISLTLNSLSGQIVSNTYSTATVGSNTLLYDAPLASGIYIYTLHVDGKSIKGNLIIE
jgi:hypothetical protein